MAATIALYAWIAALLAFILFVGFQASGKLLAALGALASMLFATSFSLYAVASRRETRAMAALVARDDLRAARSRR